MKLLSIKLERDLRAARGRVWALTLALALSSASVLGLVHAHDRLLAAMADNTARTRPAHAQLMGAAPDAATLAALQAQPGIEAVRTGASARARAAGRRVLLLALPDAGEPSFARPLLQTGRWPGAGEALIERDGAAWVGDTLALDGGPRLRVSGLVHDPMLAPSSTEGVVYAYVRLSTLASLPHAAFTLVRYRNPHDQADADARTRELLAWLAARGVTVVQARVPPLGEHPHQRQAEGAMQMLLACALLCLVVCVLAAAVLLRGLLERQRGQIGVLRTLGAGTAALWRAYLGAVARLTVVCLMLATVAGLAAGEGLARLSARLLNLDLVPVFVRHAQPLSAGPGSLWWSAWLLCAALPMLAALPSVLQALRQPVRLALGRPELSRADRLDRLLLRPGARLSVMSRLVLRSLLRRRRRHGLAVLLLAVAGAVFMAGLGLRGAWLGLVEQGVAAQRHHVELSLTQPMAQDTLLGLPGVVAAEPWATQTVTWDTAGQVPLARTHADGGHGRLLLRHVPPAPTMLAPEGLQGHWPPQPGEVALNRGAAALLGQTPRLGEVLTLVTAQGPVQARLSGLFDEALAPASAYVPAVNPGPATQWRLRLQPAVSPGAWLAALAPAMAEQVTAATTTADHRRAAMGHVLVLVRSVSVVALATALVGLLTLASSLGSAVAERRAEFATLRSLGAQAGLLSRSVILEGLVVTALSVLAALALWPLLEGALVARLGAITGQPLRPSTDWLPALAWVAIAHIGAVCACGWPARAAYRSPLKPALDAR